MFKTDSIYGTSIDKTFGIRLSHLVGRYMCKFLIIRLIIIITVEYGVDFKRELRVFF